MKKLLLTLAVVLLGLAPVMAETVSLPETGKTWDSYTWTKSGDNYEATISGYKFLLEKNTSSSALVTPASEIRVYAGARLTITAPDGTPMTAVNGTVASSSKATAATVSAGWTVATQPTTTANSPFSFTATVGQSYITFDGSGKQLRVKTLEITVGGGTVTPTAPRPVITCANNLVTITAEGADAIYYTTDGTDPTTASTKYTEPFAITATTTVKAISTKEGMDNSAVVSFVASYAGAYKNFAELIAAGANTTGTVAGPLAVYYQNGRYLYIYDADSQGMLFYGTAAKEYANGTRFTSTTAKYELFNSTPEFTGFTFEGESTGAAVEPDEVGLDEISANMRYKYVKVANVNISGVSGRNFTITDADNNTLAGYNKFDLTTLADIEGATLVGIVDVYNNNPQILFISAEGGQVLEAVADPVIAPEAGEVTAGTKVSITCATEGASIFYTLDGSKPSAASTEYTGEFEISNSCTVSAIAVKEGMADSKVVTADYVILAAGTHVADFNFNTEAKGGNVAKLTTATIAASNVQKPEDANNINFVKFVNGPITLWVEQGEGSTNPRWWAGTSDTELRFYNGNTLVIATNTDGYKIASVDFVKGYGSNFSTDKMTVTPATGTWSARVWTAGAEDKVNRVSFATTATVNTGAVQVTYVEESGVISAVSNIAADDENAPAEYYNLQGVRVNNPAPGIYIVRRGNKVSKVLVR